MEKNRKRIVAITGASSGIGFATALEFLSSGDTVYCLSRTPAEDKRIKHIPCDVGDAESVKAAFDTLGGETGRIDVLVLNAGFGVSGAVEATDAEYAEKQFDINFFGVVRCINHGTALVRKAGGHIIFMSSLAGVVPLPFQGYYSSSKAAVLNLSRAFKNEVKPFGVRVAAVLPGDVRTPFIDKRKKNISDIYSAGEQSAVAIMEKDELKGMSPQKIARLVHKISQKRRPRPCYTAGFNNKVILLLSRLCPPALVDFMVRKMYIKTK